MITDSLERWSSVCSWSSGVWWSLPGSCGPPSGAGISAAGAAS